MAGSGIFCVVLVAGSLLNGFINVDIHTPAQAPRPAQAKQPPTAEEANGELQTKVALTTQAQELANFKQQAAKSQPPAKAKSATPIVTKPATVPAPNPVPVYPQERPVRLRQRMPVTQTVPPKTVTRLQASPTPPVDPTQQWLAAANIGSYGSVSDSSTEVSSASSDNGSNFQAADELATNNSTNDSEMQLSGGIGQAPALPNGATIASTNYPISALPIAQSQPVTERTNFNNNALNYPASSHILMVGTKVSAKLDTRIAWTNDVSVQQAKNFRIKLKEPLKRADGSIAIPKGGYILARVIEIGNSATVQLLPIAITTANGRLVAVDLPADAILIQGKNGNPLQAKVHSRNNDSGDNLGNALLSGVSRASGLLGSGRIETQVAGEVLDEVQNRIQRSPQSQQQNLDIFVLDRGTSLELYVNQPVSL